MSEICSTSQFNLLMGRHGNNMNRTVYPGYSIEIEGCKRNLDYLLPDDLVQERPPPISITAIEASLWFTEGSVGLA